MGGRRDGADQCSAQRLCGVCGACAARAVWRCGGAGRGAHVANMHVTMSYDCSSPNDSALPKEKVASGRRQRATSSISLDVSTPCAPGAVENPVPQQRSSTVASVGSKPRSLRRTSSPE